MVIMIIRQETASEYLPSDLEDMWFTWKTMSWLLKSVYLEVFYSLSNLCFHLILKFGPVFGVNHKKIKNILPHL